MPGNPGGGTSGGGGGGVTDHGALTGLADDDHTQYSLIATGAGAPATTPGREGLIYVDTDADTVYVSTDTASSADWTLLDADGHTHVLADITDSGALAALSTVGTSELDDEAVTAAKLQHISEDKFLGRSTAGTGDVEILTPTEARGILNYIKTGAGTPASTGTSPGFVGQIYIDTTNDTAYVATDTVGAASFERVDGLQNVVEDTAPQLGGDLDGGGNNITNTGAISPQTDSTFDLGTTLLRWLTAYCDNLIATDQIRVGANPSSLDELDVDGAMLLTHTATENDDHALEIDCDAAGFGDVKALDIDYITGAIASGEDEAVVLVNIDETSATGGDVIAFDVLATAGSADKIIGLFAGAGIDPIEQISGAFGDADSVDDNGTDQTTALSTGGAGNIAVFTNNSEYLILGSATKFEEIELDFGTVASGAGIAPTFEYSTGVGTWATFTPVDGTNSCRNTGVIAWLDGDIPSWATGAGSEYLIRITRTRISLTTTPILDLVQIVTGTEFYWDKNGNLDVNSIAVAGNVDGRDVSADGTKLDGIEAGADVTDLTNIRAALAATTAAQSATADTFPYVDADGTMQRATAAEIVTQGNDDLSIVPQNRVSTTVDPDANDDTNSGYLVNDLWTNTSTDITFICVDNTALSAIWTPITGATSAAGTPASAPDFVGQIYIDTTSEDVYVAVDTAAASDFVLLDQDGHTHTLADITDSGALAALATVGTSEIDDEAVTNAKLAHVATDTIKGRTTAGTGDPEDMTPAQVRTMLNVEDGATADQTGAEIKSAYEAEADTNAFTDADHSKLDGIEASATANPRSATSIFEATLSSATQNCNGTQGSTFDFTWTTSVNNGTYIDTFVNGDSIISFVEAGEYVVDTAIIILNSAMTGRLIFTGQIRHENSSAVEQYTHTLAASYIRDTNASYDSGGVAGQVTVFAAAGDQLKIRRVVLDTAASGSNVYADQTETKVRIQKID